jgi:hypothetical protein
MAKTSKSAERAWTDRDSALWHTCEIAVDVAAGRHPKSAPTVATAFPPSFGPGEVVWASGPFRLLDHRAPGDGTYQENQSFFFATGRGGLAATAAVAATRAAGNRSRRRAAEWAAQPRWMQIDQGTVYVSSHGLYLHTVNAVLTWSWTSITAATMVGPGDMHFNGDSVSGPISWILRSDWAELSFVLWAIARHPQHVQLLTGGWLPPGWLEWCASQYQTRLRTPALHAT